MYKVTATIEHEDKTYTDHRNKVREQDLDATKRNMKQDAPTGSTITIEIEKY